MVAKKTAALGAQARYVGFGLGIGPEPQRKLDADTPARPKPLAQRFANQVDRRGMRCVLSLGDDEASFQELDRIVFVEHAHVDQPAVLPSGPAPCPDRRRAHAPYANAPRRHGSMPQAQYTTPRGQVIDARGALEPVAKRR